LTFPSATDHNQDLIALLRELRTQVPGHEQGKIDSLLSGVCEPIKAKQQMAKSKQVTDDIADAAAAVQSSPEKVSDKTDEQEEPGEAGISAEVGSNEDQDLVDEDLMQDEQTRATGFIGKASEIQWLRKLHQDDGQNDKEGPYGPPGPDQKAASERLAAFRRRQENHSSELMHTSKASYFLDDEPLDTDLLVEPFEMPPFKTAERLLLTYMEICHSTFPFLAKKVFMNEFYNCELP
jgi:hypothetical protein